VTIVLELSQRKHIPCRDIQVKLVVYPLAGVMPVMRRIHKPASGRRDQDRERLLSFLDTMRDTLVSCTAVDSQSKYEGSSLPDRNGRILCAAHPGVIG
jgi:hypothetical protein